MRRLSAITGPRAKWVVFFAWIVVLVAMLAANLPGRFADAEENESRSFLPGSAESTAVLDVTERLAGAETAPTVIVYHRDGGLTDADRQRIVDDVARLDEATRAFSNTTPFANPVDPEASPPYLLAPDGATALIGNVIRAEDTGDTGQLLDPIDRYRELVSDPGGGLEVKVTGPAGFSADAIKVFEGINTTLVGAALLLVIVLLILIYRSPVFWFFPILAVVVAELSARGAGWVLTELGVTVNGQTSAIQSILVIGAGTDYALLLVARYREELRHHQDKHEAMAIAVRRAGPAILASGVTVMATLLSLSLAKVNGTSGLGPVGATGIGVALLVMLTFLPALLAIVGRRPFWPFVPYGPQGRGTPDHAPMRVPGLAPLVDRLGPGVTTFAVVGVLAALGALAASPAAGLVALAAVAAIVGLLVGPYRRLRAGPLERFEARMHAREHAVDETHGWWRTVGEWVARRPRLIGAGGLAVLVVMALGLLDFSSGLTQSNQFRGSVESVEGQALIARSFPPGQAAPTDVVLSAGGDVDAVVAAAAGVPGVADVSPQPVAADDRDVQLAVYLDADPYSQAAFDTVPRLRDAVRAVEPDALVGGPSAIEHDLREAAVDDTILLIPIALAIVLVILAVLLRSLVAPVLLVATVVMSFLAALGVSAVVFDVIFGFPGSDPSIPLYSFIFLVALGVDYNIFLMARVREEALRHGTRDGMLRGLAVTGGVITSAGIVLAGTFAVLGVLPLTLLTELGFIIAFGVLLDTFVVRSILVPALVFDIGPRIWWPSRRDALTRP
ncbi:MAG: MMPL family transporter [Solirubrobacteraceae bacterium]|nr:MMPL family transporter [Solirubrobacteraceae bacterium]